MLKKNRKEEVFNSINELITLLTLLKIKVESLSEDSESLQYIAFVLSLGNFAISRLHKELMMDEEVKSKKGGSELKGGKEENVKKRFALS
jgi:hypothetical protein